eukprot:CAMPEP_0118973746 /NCGR_PEP_ID=MMETSP1173-20130426/10868_1 /TAXON_ID=1034831 /ORGANISM="Rhizochromulina marina cf, Strain CCMP1243" /LENGTH=62 /DNA_ID=CAMNT_0006923439 /DNA_START=277 /DNA_END=462 /DNA_ORIENTATION=+
MRENHSATAVPLEAKLVQGVPLGVVRLQQRHEGLPLVPHDLPASEAPHRDDHPPPGLRRRLA